ncbi:hypothetical protein [Legionella drozanskii]|uniref:Uncharacterized protein n=1 Tax=Legionella drozanskii LLAP-1 TaxID=1212489 RepID=A0A0W0SXG6_9GAMM|nr:hypothetical protein [Legionella drozanskii]KTC87637.1 hypothetical protein Ldro_1256 [Legionella drozanskii LLAP-1]
MASTIAWQISDDFDLMVDDGEFDCPSEANEQFLNMVQSAAISHIQENNQEIYAFLDGSTIKFKGNSYRVESSA